MIEFVILKNEKRCLRNRKTDGHKNVRLSSAQIDLVMIVILKLLEIHYNPNIFYLN